MWTEEYLTSCRMTNRAACFRVEPLFNSFYGEGQSCIYSFFFLIEDDKIVVSLFNDMTVSNVFRSRIGSNRGSDKSVNFKPEVFSIIYNPGSLEVFCKA